MYPSPHPMYGLQPSTQPPVDPQRKFEWSQIPRDLVELGPSILSAVVGAFIGRSLLLLVGVPGWLGAVVGMAAIGPLLLRIFHRMYAAS